MPAMAGALHGNHSGKDWHCKYLRRCTDGFKSKTCTWREGRTHRYCLLLRSTWAWRRQTELTGEEGPCDLSEVPDEEVVT